MMPELRIHAWHSAEKARDITLDDENWVSDGLRTRFFFVG